jgi:hypothetical protein
MPFATDILMPGHQKTVTHTGWGLAYECTIEAMEDDRYDMIRKYAMWLAFTAGYTIEKRAANILNNGFTTELTADGVSLFNTAHPLVRGGTARNRPSSDVDFSWTALRDAVIDLETEPKHDSGQLASSVENVVIVCPPHLEMTVDRAINSNGIPDQQDNGRNSLKNRRDFTIVVNKLLTDTDAWFLLAGNKDMHGVKAYERVPITQMEPEIRAPRTACIPYASGIRSSRIPGRTRGARQARKSSQPAGDDSAGLRNILSSGATTRSVGAKWG